MHDGDWAEEFLENCLLNKKGKIGEK